MPLVVSNHGGRQIDGVPATIDALPEIMEAVAVMGEFWRAPGLDSRFRGRVAITPMTSGMPSPSVQ